MSDDQATITIITDPEPVTLVCSHCEQPAAEAHVLVPGRGEVCPGHQEASC